MPSRKTTRLFPNALALCCLLALMQPVTALAQAGAQTSQTVVYRIAGGPLDTALNQFSTQSKLQVVYSPELVAGKTTSGLSGQFAPQEALKRLLQGTGLGWNAVNDSMYVLKRNDAAPEQTKRSPKSDAQEKATELDPIIVTGSHIRRTELEGPSPVIMITRQDLDRSGRSTVAEALAQLPQNFASPVSVGQGNGTQAVNLRGLGVDNTLVLINGRRVASSGASGDSPFVDLNSIPLAAVERIEVLTDGASALYGSDAVTGVVNIILKKDFVGSEISLNYGASQEGGASERQVSFTTGWAKGGFNALFSGEYFNRSRLAATGRSFSASDDRRVRGGRDRRFNFANPGNVFSTVPGQNLPGLDASSAGIPAGQDGRGLTPADFAATAGQLNLQSVVADFSDLVPESERFGLNARLDGALTSRLTVFAEAGVSHNEAEQATNPPLLAVVVPETNPFNPFGVPVQVNWLATELPATNDFESDNQRVLVGLEGRLWENWAWETSFGYSRDEFEQLAAPLPVSGPILDELLSRTDPATALNVFGDGAGANSPEVLAELGFGRSTSDGVGEVLTVAGKADGPVLEWAGRELLAAVGWEYREESFDSTAQAFQVDPQVPSFTSALGGDREIIAGFVELDLPLFGPEHGIPGLRALELQVAARFEHYSDFGDTADPKLALRWQPIESLAVRGSLGTSFRAPSLSELFRVVTPSPQNVTDPRRNESIVVDGLAGGNPDLEPEKSRSWNLGFVWDAPFLPGLSLSTDLWGLRQQERITALSANELLAAEAIFPDRVTRAAPTAEDIAAGLPGRLLALDRTSLNASEARLRGVDVVMNYVADSAVGHFDLRFNGAYIYRATRQLTPVTPVEQLVGVLSGVFIGETTDRPEAKFRANLSLFWSRGAWEAGVTERYTGRSRDPFSTLHPVVGDQFETDVQVNYAWPGDTGWLAGTRLSLGAVNVFNNKPPFRDGFFGFSTALHAPRQAFYQLRLTKAFGKTTP